MSKSGCSCPITNNQQYSNKMPSNLGGRNCPSALHKFFFDMLGHLDLHHHCSCSPCPFQFLFTGFLVFQRFYVGKFFLLPSESFHRDNSLGLYDPENCLDTAVNCFISCSDDATFKSFSFKFVISSRLNSSV